MRVREMREFTLEELKARIADTRKEVVELRFQLAQRKLENTAKLRTQRKKLAQLLTVESEKQGEIVERSEANGGKSREAEAANAARADLVDLNAGADLTRTKSKVTKEI